MFFGIIIAVNILLIIDIFLFFYIMSKVEDVYKLQTPALRLKMVILQYFKTQKILSAKVAIPPDTLSRYVKGRLVITEKAAIQMQDLAGISADFILNGNLPMMLDEAKSAKPYEVKYQGKAAISEFSQLDAEFDTAESNRGFVPRSVLDDSWGNRDNLTQQGKVNVIDNYINGLKNARLIGVQSVKFVERYKSVFALKLNCDIILEKNYRINDDVFVRIDEVFYLAMYKNEKIFVDAVNNKEIPIAENSEIKIYGAFYSSTVKGRLK